MDILNRDELKQGQVTYINNSLGLHRIENPSHIETAITLHLYVLSYDHCNTFDEHINHINETTVTFYSINGQLISDVYY